MEVVGCRTYKTRSTRRSLEDMHLFHASRVRATAHGALLRDAAVAHRQRSGSPAMPGRPEHSDGGTQLMRFPRSSRAASFFARAGENRSSESSHFIVSFAAQHLFDVPSGFTERNAFHELHHSRCPRTPAASGRLCHGLRYKLPGPVPLCRHIAAKARPDGASPERCWFRAGRAC